MTVQRVLVWIQCIGKYFGTSLLTATSQVTVKWGFTVQATISAHNILAQVHPTTPCIPLVKLLGSTNQWSSLPKISSIAKQCWRLTNSTPRGAAYKQPSEPNTCGFTSCNHEFSLGGHEYVITNMNLFYPHIQSRAFYASRLLCMGGKMCYIKLTSTKHANFSSVKDACHWPHSGWTMMKQRWKQ